MDRRSKGKHVYSNQKVVLYFDENFPQNIIEAFKKHRIWKKKLKIFSVHDAGNRNKEDKFQANYCKRMGYVLVTLDNDFMNDSKYPFSKIPGIVRIVANPGEERKIKACLGVLFDFLCNLPWPKLFFGDTKFQVSESGCIIRGRHSKSREIVEMRIAPKARLFELMKFFGYFI